MLWCTPHGDKATTSTVIFKSRDPSGNKMVSIAPIIVVLKPQLHLGGDATAIPIRIRKRARTARPSETKFACSVLPSMSGMFLHRGEPLLAWLQPAVSLGYLRLDLLDLVLDSVDGLLGLALVRLDREVRVPRNVDTVDDEQTVLQRDKLG